MRTWVLLEWRLIVVCLLQSLLFLLHYSWLPALLLQAPLICPLLFSLELINLAEEILRRYKTQLILFLLTTQNCISFGLNRELIGLHLLHSLFVNYRLFFSFFNFFPIIGTHIFFYFTCREKIVVPADKPFITISGTKASNTIITWSDGGEIFQSATFTVLASDFVGRFLTIEVFCFASHYISKESLSKPQLANLYLDQFVTEHIWISRQSCCTKSVSKSSSILWLQDSIVPRHSTGWHRKSLLQQLLHWRSHGFHLRKCCLPLWSEYNCKLILLRLPSSKLNAIRFKFPTYTVNKFQYLWP